MKWKIFKETPGILESYGPPMWVVWDSLNNEYLFENGCTALSFVNMCLTDDARFSRYTGDRGHSPVASQQI